MSLHQLDVDRYQPLMQPGEHQRQEGPDSTAPTNNPPRSIAREAPWAITSEIQPPSGCRATIATQPVISVVSSGLRISSMEPGRAARSFLNPAHQDDHQQHRNHPAAPGLESLAKQGYLRKLRAGENTGHHPAHRH